MNSIGIDLGTTNTVASIMRASLPEVLRNAEDEQFTPSVVSFRRSGGESGYLVGQGAINYARQAPQETVYSVKRLMGLSYDDAKVRQVSERVPYRVVAAQSADDAGAHVLINGRPHSPTEVSALILKKVKADCEQITKQAITRAAITVPAYFLDNQRNATKEAGEAAGLELHPLLNEPVAAALAFGFQRSDGPYRLLVYDLGGGTFDVSIVQIAADSVEVLHTLGDMWLGGDDFDTAIIQRLERWLAEKYQIHQVAEPETRQRLKALAEHAKKRLSASEEYTVREPYLMQHQDIGPVSIDMTITRDEFNADVRSHVNRTLDLIDEVMDRASLLPQHLSGVVLAGGSTRVPIVREELMRRFGKDKVRRDVDPMQCVSLGAALWTERFPFDNSGKISKKQAKHTGIPIPMDVGVEVFCDGNPHHFEPIISRDTTYPTEHGLYRKQFYPTSDNQRLIRVPVFQGNSAVTSYNSRQGVIEHQLPTGIPARTPVWIEFIIDLHGNLTGKLEFEGHPELSTDWSIKRNQPALGSEEAEQLENWRQDLENMANGADNFLRKYGDFMTPTEQRELSALIHRAREAVNANDRSEFTAIRNGISMALLGSGVASDLYLAQRAQEMASSPEVAKQIAKARAALEVAYKAGDEKTTGEISDGLKLAVHRVFEIDGRRKQSSGPLPGQLGK